MPDTFKDYLERNIKKVVAKFTDMIQNVTPFIGTEAEWNALSAAEQAKYNIKDIIGEGTGVRYVRNPTTGEWVLVSGTPERSYVGMIIHSTTLDTEAKVKAFYGGTTWIQHSGYMLRGATSSVTANQASSDGGADSVSYTPAGSNSGGSVSGTAINTNQMPSHTHLEYKPVDTGSGPLVNRNKSGNVSGDTIANDVGNIQWGWYTNKFGIYTAGTGSTQSHSHGFTNPTFTGTAATINTLPKYKNVYIWERTA